MSTFSYLPRRCSPTTRRCGPATDDSTRPRIVSTWHTPLRQRIRRGASRGRFARKNLAVDDAEAQREFSTLQAMRQHVASVSGDKDQAPASFNVIAHKDVRRGELVAPPGGALQMLGAVKPDGATTAITTQERR
jgi:hypothetical protein